MHSRRLANRKKVIFFDGDGTLWYPRSTLRTRKPHWVYLDETITDPITELVATPTAITTLQQIGELGIVRVLLSTSPLEQLEAFEHRKTIAKHVGVFDVLDDICIAPEVVTGKAEKIKMWLQEHKIDPKHALMVGDTYHWDIVAAQSVGVEGLLLNGEHDLKATQDETIVDIVIDDLSDVLSLLNT